MGAAENGHHDMCRWLLGRGANPNAAMETTGWTATHAAAKTNNIQCLRVLLEAGGNPLLLAAHRDFGRQLAASDVTKDPATLAVLKQRE